MSVTHGNQFLPNWDIYKNQPLWRNYENVDNKFDSPQKYPPSDYQKYSTNYDFPIAPSLFPHESWNPSNTLRPCPVPTTPFIANKQSSPVPQPASPSDLGQLTSPETGSAPPAKSRSERKPIPAEKKDQRYFERRLKNNDAARKSRESRRVKETTNERLLSIATQEYVGVQAEIGVIYDNVVYLRQLLNEKRATFMRLKNDVAPHPHPGQHNPGVGGVWR